LEANVVSIKGRGNGLIEIRFAKDLAYQQIREGFVMKLKSSKSFLRGASPKVIIWGRKMNKAQKWDIRTLLSMDYDITNVKFEDELDDDERELISTSNIPEPNNSNIKKIGDIRTINYGDERDPFEKEMDIESQQVTIDSSVTRDSSFICQTIRNGQRIELDGDVTILGDINDGAEVFASGSIAVLGTLRGLAHAGSGGNNNAVVAAFRMMPRQLRIGKKIAAFPDNTEADYPEIARIEKDKIMVSPLNERDLK